MYLTTGRDKRRLRGFTSNRSPLAPCQRRQQTTSYFSEEVRVSLANCSINSHRISFLSWHRQTTLTPKSFAPKSGERWEVVYRCFQPRKFPTAGSCSTHTVVSGSDRIHNTDLPRRRSRLVGGNPSWIESQWNSFKYELTRKGQITTRKFIWQKREVKK